MALMTIDKSTFHLGSLMSVTTFHKGSLAPFFPVSLNTEFMVFIPLFCIILEILRFYYIAEYKPIHKKHPFLHVAL